MRKRTVTRTWIAGLIVIAVGLIAAAVGGALIAGLGGTWSGPTSKPIFTPSYDSFFWGMVALCASGGLVMVVGALIQLVAWIGALVNTARAQDKTWFILLLVLGLVGLQFIMMIVYLVAGPDVPESPRAYTPPYAPPAPPPAAPRPI